MFDVIPVPVKHFLDGLTVAHLPGVVRRGENILDRDLAPGYDRLEPEAFNVEREVVHQADAGPARRKNVPSKVVGSKTIDGRKTCPRWRFSAPRSTCCSAEGSDDMTDAPSDLSNALLTILLGRSGSSTFDGVRPPISPRHGSDHDACRAGTASRRSHLCSWAMARRSQRSRAEGRLGTCSGTVQATGDLAVRAPPKNG